MFVDETSAIHEAVKETYRPASNQNAYNASAPGNNPPKLFLENRAEIKNKIDDAVSVSPDYNQNHRAKSLTDDDAGLIQ